MPGPDTKISPINKPAFMSAVKQSMSPEDVKRLPPGQLDYYRKLVGMAVEAVMESENNPMTKALVGFVIGTCSDGKSVVYNQVNDGALMVGNEEEIVTLEGVLWPRKNKRVARIAPASPAINDIEDYISVMPLTGPRRHQHLTPIEYSLAAFGHLFK